jgi:hypothetical protein
MYAWLTHNQISQRNEAVPITEGAETRLVPCQFFAMLMLVSCGGCGAGARNDMRQVPAQTQVRPSYC